jgi:tetratricopeptide (TPR) repeat protein
MRLTEEALKKRPNLPSALLVQAKASIAQGDYQRAEALLENALAQDPVSLPALAALLAVHTGQRRIHETLPRIAALAKQHPAIAGLHFLLALAHFGLQDVENSEASLRRSIALDPGMPSAYTLLANINLAQGLVDKAKENLRKAIALSPLSVTNHMALKNLYEKEGKWDEVKRLYEEARKVDPGSPYLANDLAYHYLEHGGDVHAAISLAESAKQKIPDSPVVADTLGWAYYKSGQHEPAIVQLKESVRLAPDNRVYHYHLGMAYLGAGQLELAKRSLRNAVEGERDFPHMASAQAALDQLSKAEF